ncbi:unnamed protein product [Clonostachys solani]|uniref:DUF6536 domain-containing protein n=1 Tax=Clonostachys solani TaxID=160281 RepID=A0A9N9ZJV0_9HYPO|nr:unnamed protein product [Clonostachys solani]
MAFGRRDKKANMSDMTHETKHAEAEDQLGIDPAVPFIPNSKDTGKKGRKWIPTGWKFGTAAAAFLTSIVLIINIVVAIICRAKISSKTGSSSIGPVLSGDCASINKIGIGIHLVINIVSTLLLGASNYCMQTLSAPTREDIDKAHKRGSWMDIGIPSLRNIRFVRKRRLLVCLSLALTSIPLHLVYNSTFFVSSNNHLYRVWFADESFATGAPYNATAIRDYFTPPDVMLANTKRLQQRLMQGEFEKLSNDECINAYAKNLLQDRGDVVLIIDRPDSCTNFPKISYAPFEECGNTSATSLYSVVNYENGMTPLISPRITNWFSWICSQRDFYVDEKKSADPPPAELCSDGAWKKQLGADPWIVGTKVHYCLSEKLPNECQINVAISLLYVVIGFNIVKLVLILTMASSNWINHKPLVTLGDAVASFIAVPDPRTEGMCLLSTKEIIKHKGDPIISATIYRPEKRKWASGVSKRRWIAASLLTFVALAVILALLGYGIYMLKTRYQRGDFNFLWSLGLGSITPYNLIQWNIPTSGDIAVIATVLVVNLPQVLLSILYIILNGLFTTMAAAGEWSSFSHKNHQPLRVSFPKGAQRSSFFLQLPYQYGIPLLVLSVLMHWLISQSIFLSQINEWYTYQYKKFKTLDASEWNIPYITGGYSPVAIAATCVIIVIIFLAAVVLGRRPLRHGIPVAGSCSLAISAACHTPEGTSELLPLRWGVVRTADSGHGGIGHCSFSNDRVELPQAGSLYA